LIRKDSKLQRKLEKVSLWWMMKQLLILLLGYVWVTLLNFARVLLRITELHLFWFFASEEIHSKTDLSRIGDIVISFRFCQSIIGQDMKLLVDPFCQTRLKKHHHP